MQKLLTLIITIVILYTIIQVKMKEEPKASAASQNIEAQNSHSQNKEAEKQQLTGSFLEKTLSSVLINVLKTEQGRLFFENIIKPVDKPIAGTDYSFKLNNTELLKSMLKISSFDEGTKGPVSCGHIVTVHYKALDMSNNMFFAFGPFFNSSTPRYVYRAKVRNRATSIFTIADIKENIG